MNEILNGLIITSHTNTYTGTKYENGEEYAKMNGSWVRPRVVGGEYEGG